MEKKTCSMCNIEKQIEDFQRKKRECENCNSRRSLNYYYDNKDEMSSERKYIVKKKERKTITEKKS